MFSAENKDKLFQTFWLFCAYILVGFDNGLVGPCVPDLRQNAGVSLQLMSYVFLLQGAGIMCGSLVALYPERCLDQRLLTATYVLVGSVVNMLIPLTANYYYMLVIFFLQGLSLGMLDYSSISLCNSLWEKNKALTFQFIIIGFGVGTVVSPLIAQPFIKAKVTESVTASALQAACPLPHPPTSPLPFLTSQHLDSNLSHPFAGDDGIVFPVSTHGSPGGGSLQAAINEDIKWPFIIAGFLSVPSSLAFFYFYFTRPTLRAMRTSPDDDKAAVEAPPAATEKSLLKSDKADPPFWAVCLFRGLLILLHIPAFGLQVGLADLLTSIGMMSPFCMTAQEANYFTVVIWGTSLLSRVLGLGFLAFFSVLDHLMVNTVGMLFSAALLMVGVRTSPTALWIGTAGVGLFGTSFLPGYMTWSSDYLPLTPLFINLSFATAGFGVLLLPFVFGQILAAFGSFFMLGTMLAVSLLLLLLFLFVVFLGKRYIKRQG